ncbi:unnamed protein product [Moneuplotes crassus]|uniref:Uncharacterized protein n=1 Tax=Euplotes crassus TaxID=5936 RepID=A0AAD1UDB6_EUPCR|nr:unnamed protein product [Moneuplotes crassus]
MGNNLCVIDQQNQMDQSRNMFDQVKKSKSCGTCKNLKKKDSNKFDTVSSSETQDSSIVYVLSKHPSRLPQRHHSLVPMKAAEADKMKALTQKVRSITKRDSSVSLNDMVAQKSHHEEAFPKLL